MKAAARLSRPLPELKPRYTVVVVGSGYGAAIAASRLARAGQSVCVLERGREIRPGDYPADLSSAATEMQIDTARGRLGNPLGLFNLHMNDDMLAMVGCGLGGTSLINANVALTIEPRMFEHAHWPAEFRAEPTLLDPYCEHARQMLDAKPYPDTFPLLNKLRALEQSAQVMKQPFYRPPIAVNFEDQVNPFGVGQKKCALCGDCTTGCNHAAKNTTLMNYLPDACNHGAEVFAQVRVTHIEQTAEGWQVHFERNGPAPEMPDDAAPARQADTPGNAAPARDFVTADIVMLGAGSLGSTEILLRSKARGLALSDRLGQAFSGNGDVLAVGYDNYGPVADSADGTANPPNLNGMGAGTSEVTPADLPGPCITGVIDMRHNPDIGNALVIEEGVIPGALASMMAPALFFANAQVGNFFKYGAAQVKSRLLDAQATGEAIQNDPGSLADLCRSGPVARTQTYLVMSVDDAGGRLALRDDRLRIDWPGAGDSPVIARDNVLIEAASNAIQGQFIANPLWSKTVGRKLITVHPVGGCGMGDSAADGVVDHRCRVFSSNQGTAVHPGLYVCDGAVMPGSVGVNPLLTISAVAERACKLLADDRGWTIDYRRSSSQPLPMDFGIAATATVTATAAAPAMGPAAMAPAAAAPDLAAAVELPPRGLLGEIENYLSTLFIGAEQALAGELRGLLKDVLNQVEDGAIDLAKTLLAEIIRKYPDALSPSFEFTETMHGYVSTRAVNDTATGGEHVSGPYELANAWGRAEGNEMRFELRIASSDLNRLTADPEHTAEISGTVTCAALSDRPMTVRSGIFHLLTLDARRVETWSMSYDMVLERPQGDLHFHGFKILHQKPGSSWWYDVTTLFVTVREGGPQGRPLAKGTLRLGLEDLMWQGASIKVATQPGLLGELQNRFPRARNAIDLVYMGKFAGFFGMLLFKSYGGLLANLKNFSASDDLQRPRRALRAPAPDVFDVALPDGFHIKLTRYHGGDRGPVVMAPGFAMTAASFSIDTVDENFVEYLAARHYDVWLFDYRGSPDSGSPLTPFTIDDIARIDWPAAVRFILQRTGAQSLQAVAHCVGSMSLLMAMLEGMPGVRSVISSQLTLHPVTDWLNYMKADMNMVGLIEGISGRDGALSVVPGTSDLDHEIDVLAWNVPVPEGEECKNPVCRRIFSIFGPPYAHRQLNHWTHTALCEMFGTVAVRPFEHLTLIMKRGRVVDAAGNDSYLQPAKAKNLALPITFVAGGLNQLFFPETSSRTWAWLRSHNDPGLYQQRLFPGYAHLDLFIGRDAAKEVYPFLLGELERTSSAPAR